MANSPNLVPSQHLPFRTKLLYGFGDWGNSTTYTIIAFFFSFFLTDIARLDPAYAAVVLLIGGVWDAVNDPLIGVLTDRVHTRWGRRRPFFLLGALPFTLTFIMLWWVPPWDGILKAVYYTLAYILFDTAFTFLAVPYTALTPELTEDYDERTHLNGYRMSVSMAGGLISAVAVPLITSQFTDRKTGYLLMAVGFGVLASVPYLLLFFGIRERFANTARSSLSVFSGFLYTWRNRSFRFAAGIYLTSWVTIGLVAALFQYYLTYWMHMADQLEIVLGIVQLGALICIPIMVWLAGKLGKKGAYQLGMVWWALVMLAISFLPTSAKPLVFLLAALAGLGIAAAHVIPWSMVPDVIEEDELETGHRREGTYYGFLVFLQKSGTALVLALVQWVLHLTGYTPGAVQPPATLLAMRIMIGPLPALLLAISFFLAWRYPLSRARHAKLREQLAAKRISID